jgi:proline dehydrogenase
MVTQILQEQTKDLKAITETTRTMNDYAMALHARQAVTDEVIKVMMANAVDLAQAKIDLVNAAKNEASKGGVP